MRKTVKRISLILFTFSLFLSPSINYLTVSASENFETDVSTEYKAEENGITHVTQTITLKNLKSQFFAKSYVFTLANIEPENIKAYETGTLLKVQSENTEDATKIIVDFNEKSVGKGNTKTFVLTFDTKVLSKKSGEIWEITIPKLKNPENYNEYKVILNVPEVFGEEAFISPEPISANSKNNRTYYYFTKEKISKAGVTAGFGKFQVFDFQIKYRLENNEDNEKITEVAIPPDTSVQRLLYQGIDPMPFDMKQDTDDNWILLYKLKAGEKIDVRATGKAQIFASPLNFNQNAPVDSDLLPTAYWQSDDSRIKQAASNLNGAEDIYNFIREKLKYNYEKFGLSYERKGAIKALELPEDSLCMEFTDLFIALARAKGIPAREVNGYAYSLNPEAEPLSLINNKLHAWPEYWDEGRKLWVPVDPTWGSTTGGVDFFNKFDLRHFAFVVHGENPVLPYTPGSSIYGESEDDVIVNFGSLPSLREPQLDVSFEYSRGFPLFKREVLINLKNNGPAAIYNYNSSVLFDEAVNSKSESITLLPFQTKTERIEIPYGLFGSKSPNRIKVVSSYAEVDIPNEKSRVILNQSLLITSLLLIILLYYLIRFKRKMKKEENE